MKFRNKKKTYIFALAIPTFNNHYDIQKLYKNFKKAKLKNYFICFIDDSYNNSTIKEIKKNFKKHYTVIKGPRLRNGRCAAVKTGFDWILKNINTEVIIEMDSDLSYNPLDIKKGLKALKNHTDLVIGSKYLKNSIVKNRSKSRIFFSYIVSLICRKIFLNKITDYTNGFRFYNRYFLQKIVKKKLTYDSPSENLNILLFSIYLKGKIKEIPSFYEGNLTSHWSLGIFSIIKLLLQTVIVILRYLLKIYF